MTVIVYTYKNANVTSTLMFALYISPIGLFRTFRNRTFSIYKCLCLQPTKNSMKKLLTTLSLFTSVLASTNTSAADLPPILYAGSRLNPGDNMVSNNKVYQLSMQSDTNLVIYRRSYLDKVGSAMIERGYVTQYNSAWSIGTGGFTKNAYAAMQSDGNFIVYAQRFISGFGQKWAANAGNNTPDNYRLVLGEDGSLTIQTSQGSIIQYITTDKTSPDDFSIYFYPICRNGMYTEGNYSSGGVYAADYARRVNATICPNGFPPGLIPGR